MKKGLVVLTALLMVFSLVITGCGGEEKTTIVALVPLTGALGTYGQNSAEAAKLAAEDVNAWLEEQGREWRLNLVTEDTQTEPATALRKMQNWYGNGVKFFTGPQASGEAKECLGFANGNQVLFVSQSSTSPSLSIADDWLFRFCTSDEIQGPAIARAVEAAGVTHAIFAWQGDTWGDGLNGATVESVKKLGINAYPDGIRFDPLLEDFAKEAKTLNDYVTDLVDQGVPLDEIGFCIVTYEQIVPFMNAAREYPQLREIYWFGSDGTVKSEALIKDAEAAKFAIDTKFNSPMNRPETGTTGYAHVTNSLKERIGREPDAYAYNNYDIVWVLAMCIDEVGYDPVKVKEILPRVTDEWTSKNGASGHVVLNEFGDRAFADYDFWLINENMEWEFVGYYDGKADAINWEREVY